MFNVKMSIALLIVTVIALLPILAWKRSRRMFLPLLLLYMTFIYFYRDFAFAKVTGHHDTYWSFFEFYSLIRQWIVDGVTLGWNPYLSGGQPLSLLSNIFLYAPAIIFFKTTALLGLSFSNEEFFSIVWIFNHLWVCTGFYLLFQLWFDSAFWAVFGMCAILLGGLFQAELASPGYFISVNYLPYLLFSLILFWKYKQWPGLYLFASFLGIAFNRYLPVYLVSYLGIFLLSYAISNFTEFKDSLIENSKLVKSSYYKLIIALVLFVVPASPFINSYLEQKANNYISPTRGFVTVGDISSNSGFQPNTSAPWDVYRTLERINDPSLYRSAFTAFYIGLLPLFTLLPALYFFIRSGSFRSRVGVLFVALACAYFLGAGDDSPLPLWHLMRQLPFFSVLRHSMHYARIVTILLIVISIETLREISLRLKRFNHAVPVLLLIVQLVNLGIFSTISAAKLIKIPSSDFESLKYPSEWKLYDNSTTLLPFDVSPMILKKSVWFNYHPDYTFMLNKDFIPLLREVSRKELYELNGSLISKNQNDLSYKKDILLPTRDFGKCDLTCLMSKLNLQVSNTFSPLYASVEVNYPVYNNKDIYHAIDGDFLSSRKVDARTNSDNYVWLKISFPDTITAYGVRVTPHKAEELWRGDKAKLEISSNNKEWTPLLKLDLNKSYATAAGEPVLFPFRGPVTAKYFRLWIDDKQFSSSAEIELVDKPLDQMRRIRKMPFREVKYYENLTVNFSYKKESEHYTGSTDFDFKGSKRIDAIFIDIEDQHYYDMNLSDVEFQVSTDKMNWNTVLRKTWYSFVNAKLHLLGEPVEAKYGRLKFNSINYYPLRYGAVRKDINIVELKFLRRSLPASEDAKNRKLTESNPGGTVEPVFSGNPNIVLLKTHSSDAANLVRFENYHSNWKVYLDNKEASMHKYGPNLQLISIPGGDHFVRMEYKSWYDALVWLHVWFVIFSWMGFVIFLRTHS